MFAVQYPIQRMLDLFRRDGKADLCRGLMFSNESLLHRASFGNPWERRHPCLLASISSLHRKPAGKMGSASRRLDSMLFLQKQGEFLRGA
jgi:hypothetical protein